MSLTPFLQADALQVGYKGHPVLPPLSFALHEREFWALIGRNGSGKTTLLRTLLGLLSRVGGTLTRRPDTRFAYVAQRNEMDLAIPARAIDVVSAGVDRGWSFLSPRLSLEGRRAVSEALEITHATELASAQLSELSEGQKQRVLLAQALASRPQVLVLDEPTSALDLLNTRAVYALLDDLRKSRDLAILIVSHHLTLVADRATHALFVDRDDQVSLAGPCLEVASSLPFRRRYGAMDCGFLNSAHGNLSFEVN